LEARNARQPFCWLIVGIFHPRIYPSEH
jgi:hypothetical protein